MDQGSQVYKIEYIPEYRNFIYKRNKYEFDYFSLIRLPYFYNKFKSLDDKKDYQLIDDEDSTDFKQEFIETFISYCEGKLIQFTEENVLALYLLSKIFEIDCLKEQTSKYMLDHPKQLLSQIILKESQTII